MTDLAIGLLQRLFGSLNWRLCFNSTKQRRERIGRLLLHANKREEIRTLRGDIAAAVGLRMSTGDTICVSEAGSAGIMDFPERCFVAIEPKDQGGSGKDGRRAR
jgi:translation elongation factor EF-G